MTRKKKTRSLKRIHGVKTGSISKFKKEAGTDRQSTRLKNRTKSKSVYQKFLDENPEIAAEEQRKAAQQSAKQNNSDTAQADSIAEHEVKEAPKPKSDKQSDDVLAELDKKNFDDLY